MIVEIIRWFYMGQMLCSFTDGFTERFMSECKKLGVHLYRVTFIPGGLTVYLSKKDSIKAFDAAEKAGMEGKLIREIGLRFYLNRYKKRTGMIIGLTAAFFLLFFLSSILWCVDITGNNRIPERELIAFLQENDVKIGTFTKRINTKDISRTVLQAFPELSWISLNLYGCKAELQIRENIEKPDTAENGRFSNIIAKEDGEIIKADILRGTGKILPGTPVIKGDLLVSGIEEFMNGGVRFVDSDAVITARTKSRLSAVQVSEIKVKTIEKCKEYYLPFVFFDYSKYLNVKKNCFTSLSCISSDRGTVFPVGFIRSAEYRLSEKSLNLNKNESLLLSFSSLTDLVYTDCKNKMIEKVVYLHDPIHPEAPMINLIYHEDIAQKQFFDVDQTG